MDAPPSSCSPVVAWTSSKADELQSAVDRIFAKDEGEIKTLDISLTIADPKLDGCPLVGCSTGFSELTGYTMEEIIGRNCRFLIDPVPKEFVNAKVRNAARTYCEAIATGQEFTLSESDREPWMPKMRHADDGLFCVQKNARKDGTLFDNMFYLRSVELDDNMFILGLQTELLFDSTVTPVGPEYMEACRRLDENMASVHQVLSRFYWYSAPMQRQDFAEDCEQLTVVVPEDMVEKADKPEGEAVCDHLFHKVDGGKGDDTKKSPSTRTSGSRRCCRRRAD
mmetsp:Transcript_45062/g.101426  ORF Transcript_45062/g.101426 Transcript_45062/m.101426 type:complete len:281 (-) Transcript_45062:57-899(-)